MSGIDWLVVALTLAFIIGYGMWKSRHTRTMQGYLLADRQLPWYHVGFSVMATQASAITFLSAPGQGYADGLRFVQFYFGLPLAMIVLCVAFVPIFHRLKVYTAYEYLEGRFDRRTRKLTALLFLLQRGLSTGITIYAPAIILSTILHIDLNITILMNGALVIIYTVYGGTKAVSHTQLLQMSIIFAGIFIAAWQVMALMPEGVNIHDCLHIAGTVDRTKALDTSLNLNDRYNLWSGLIGGFFLQLSYFGTDQSQVGRYLTGSSIAQSRLGLIMNGLVKIPMQFLILATGVLVFSYYQFNLSPIFFNQSEVRELVRKGKGEEVAKLETIHAQNGKARSKTALEYTEARASGNLEKQAEAAAKLRQLHQEDEQTREQFKTLMRENSPASDTNDSNFVFLYFVTETLPKGIIGLLITVIFLAAMGSTASGLNSLASTTMVDILLTREKDSGQKVTKTRWCTFWWGIFCVIVALFAGRLGNLIEAVNILGSLFYGTILGIFLTAFLMRRVDGISVFYAAIIAEIFIVFAWIINLTAFLWLNVIGCLLVMIIAWLISLRRRSQSGTLQPL